MKNLLSLLFLALVMLNCGGDTATETTDATEQKTPAALAEGTDEERMNQVAPPPPVCVYLTEAEVLSFFEPGVQIPMAGSRAPASFNSCQYTLDSKEWSGFLVLEMPEATNKVQSIRDEVAGATGDDAITVGKFKGRIMNGGRILSVEAAKPFRVKFSALAKTGFPEAMDAAQRRKLIIQLAEAVMAS